MASQQQNANPKHGPHQHVISGSPYGTSGSPYGTSGSPHGTSGSQHGTSGSPHGSSGSPHGTSGSPHGTSGSQHGTSGSQHGTSGSPHGTSGSPHGSSGSLHGSSGSAAEPHQLRKLFIGGLSMDTSDQTLANFYAQFGTVAECEVKRVPNTNCSRGFGFVLFSSMDGVDRAMAGRPHNIDGRIVDPRRTLPIDKRAKCAKLHVSGVSEVHTDEAFSRYFSDYGPVAKVELMKDRNTGKNRGFAFVTFDDYDPVDKCVLIRSHLINGIRCTAEKALGRHELHEKQNARQADRDRVERGMRSSIGRGSERCSCVTGCYNRKCSCRAQGRACGMLCHNASGCGNKK